MQINITLRDMISVSEDYSIDDDEMSTYVVYFLGAEVAREKWPSYEDPEDILTNKYEEIVRQKLEKLFGTQRERKES